MSGPHVFGSRGLGFLFVAASMAASAVILFSAFFAPPSPQVVTKSVVGNTEVASDALYNYETTRYQSSAKVVAEAPVERVVSIGISSGTDSLDFGEIPAGGNYAKREIMLVNLEDSPARVRLASDGGISPFVRFADDDFVLEAGASATVGVFFVAQGAEMGDYSGEVTVQIKRPRHAALPILG